jgi:hypothetical protein
MGELTLSPQSEFMNSTTVGGGDGLGFTPSIPTSIYKQACGQIFIDDVTVFSLPWVFNFMILFALSIPLTSLNLSIVDLFFLILTFQIMFCSRFSMLPFPTISFSYILRYTDTVLYNSIILIKESSLPTILQVVLFSIFHI